MKRRLLKIGLPAMAFLTAGVMAFASAKEAPAKAALVTGYIFQGGECKSAPMNCNEIGALACTYSAQQVFRNQVSSTSCSDPLTHRP